MREPADLLWYSDVSRHHDMRGFVPHLPVGPDMHAFTGNLCRLDHMSGCHDLRRPADLQRPAELPRKPDMRNVTDMRDCPDMREQPDM